MTYLLQFDGLSLNNPGESTSGAVIIHKNNIICERGEYLGESTNNRAEYNGLIIGLQECITLGIKNVSIEGDSLLVVNQINNKWKVKDIYLKKLHKQAKLLLNKFDSYTIKHIYRDKNTLADGITNETVQSKISFTRYLDKI